MFVVVFIGQKYVDNPLTVLRKLEPPIRNLIAEHGQVDFLVDKSEFGQCAATAVRRVRKEFDCGSARLTLLLSCNPMFFCSSPWHLASYYDKTEVDLQAFLQDGDSKMTERQLNAIDRANAVVYYFLRRIEKDVELINYIENSGKQLIRI